MPFQDSRGKEVQILRINEDHSFDLYESHLEAILLDDRVKDKPVVVISVAGAYRQGKSFILSFFLRYLRNNCRSNWLDDTSTRLEGFEWRGERKPHTTEMLLWDEVFLVTTPEGQEVAVLLMDTQGSFDFNSTVKDCTTIFAMSIMTSSVQVYNILRNIQEDQLQHLQFFTEYGKLAQKGTRRQPFQRLVFLVRDWAFPYDTAYGVSGGLKIVKERLEVMANQPKELQLLRREICSCFSKIENFLMPRPGDKAEMDQKFDGRLDDIDTVFKEKVLELVPWLLAPENLLVKQINGETITCHELLNYFKTYAKTFQGGHLPEPKSMLQATAEASNLASKERAKRLYMERIEKRPRGNLEQLLKTHLVVMAEIKELFGNTPTVGGDEVSQRHLDSLEKELQAHFDRLYKDEELFIQREREKEKQRELEREAERKRKEQRKLERELELERRQQRERERKAEREREEQRKVERERDEQLRKEMAQRMQKEMDELKSRLVEAERQRRETNPLASPLAFLSPITLIPATVCAIIDAVKTGK